MDCYNDIVKLDNFKYPTTYQNDYKPYCNYKKEIFRKTNIRNELPSEIAPPPPIDDHESFARWRGNIHIPFDLLLEPKPIVGIDPLKPFPKLAPLPTLQNEEARKNRQRIYMTPAVSMDDVEDPEMRQLLCNYMYTTEWGNADREATANFRKKETKILLDRRSTDTSDPVKLQVDLYKPVPERFQQRGKSWDEPQIRSLTDPTREFWLHKDPPVVCGACVDPFRNVVPKETKQNISALITSDKLRLSHDFKPPSYAGYKVRLAKGVPLAKVDLPAVHPFLSTSQAMTVRYADDFKK